MSLDETLLKHYSHSNVKIMCLIIIYTQYKLIVKCLQKAKQKKIWTEEEVYIYYCCCVAETSLLNGNFFIGFYKINSIRSFWPYFHSTLESCTHLFNQQCLTPIFNNFLFIIDILYRIVYTLCRNEFSDSHESIASKYQINVCCWK